MLWYGPHTEPSSMYPSDRQEIIRDVIFGHYHASVMFKTPFVKFRKRAWALQTVPKISRFYRPYSALSIYSSGCQKSFPQFFLSSLISL
jgi:hypothetical protein